MTTGVVDLFPLVDLEGIRALRHELHGAAELSGAEAGTAAIMARALAETAPTELVTGVGGHGLVAVYRGEAPGATVVVRAELDALPIRDVTGTPYASSTEGVSHACGHDGHMAMAYGVALQAARIGVSSGAVAIVLQPSEEDGRGAEAVVGSDAWRQLAPDWVVALHNLPGYALGTVVVKRGVFASASRGMVIRLEGSTSHAAEPEQGRSPAAALAALLGALPELPRRVAPFHEAAMVTIIHARLGEVAFGTTPGSAVCMATLRTHEAATMATLSRGAETLACGIAAAWGLDVAIEWTEEFPPVVNDDEAVDAVEHAARRLGMSVATRAAPFAWSEDVGHLIGSARGVLFGLGAGVEAIPLHGPGYDFPDELLPLGIRCLAETVGVLTTWRPSP